MKCRLFIGLAFCVVLAQCVALARDESGPAAIVSELQGSTTVKEPGKAQRTLEIYDRLSEGATITVGKGSRVVLVLVNGARFALKEHARVAVLP